MILKKATGVALALAISSNAFSMAAPKPLPKTGETVITTDTDPTWINIQLPFRPGRFALAALTFVSPIFVGMSAALSQQVTEQENNANIGRNGDVIRNNGAPVQNTGVGVRNQTQVDGDKTQVDQGLDSRTGDINLNPGSTSTTLESDSDTTVLDIDPVQAPELTADTKLYGIECGNGVAVATPAVSEVISFSAYIFGFGISRGNIDMSPGHEIQQKLAGVCIAIRNYGEIINVASQLQEPYQKAAIMSKAAAGLGDATDVNTYLVNQWNDNKAEVTPITNSGN